MRIKFLILTLLTCLFCACQTSTPRKADLLLLGANVYDGSGSEPVQQDVAITGDKISFVGDATALPISATDTLHLNGFMLTPGFIDMHSHARLDEDFGRDARHYLYQGISTVVLGCDGFSPLNLREDFSRYAEQGIGVNMLSYIEHNSIRREVMGLENRAPADDELQRMKEMVRSGMEDGAFGLSSGLFYLPGTYAQTEEVIELAKIAAAYDGIYDTHDRDLGAVYQGIGYLNSIREAIRIGEASGCRVIFSHFNAQGRRNYGRAPEGAKLIEEARARGVEVAGAQHVYTATMSNLQSYTIPGWASAGSRQAMLRRFDQPDTARMLDAETLEMLAIRGGAEKILFVNEREELNGKTLAQIADAWQQPVPQTVRKILSTGNAAVMNLELYDIENTRYLAKQDWMMTCTDGRTPRPGVVQVHPRVYGAFTRKLRQFVLEEGIISMPFAIRSMTGLAADFLRLPDRGYIRKGMYADIAVFNVEKINDPAKIGDPHHFSEGTFHVLVNGKFAFRDGKPTGVLAGVPILRGGDSFKK